nr:uncharacterized protein LOC109171572 [Ipomoea batatas]
MLLVASVGLGKNNWIIDLMGYLEHERLLEDEERAWKVKLRVLRFQIIDGQKISRPTYHANQIPLVLPRWSVISVGCQTGICDLPGNNTHHSRELIRLKGVGQGAGYFGLHLLLHKDKRPISRTFPDLLLKLGDHPLLLADLSMLPSNGPLGRLRIFLLYMLGALRRQKRLASVMSWHPYLLTRLVDYFDVSMDESSRDLILSKKAKGYAAIDSKASIMGCG